MISVPVIKFFFYLSLPWLISKGFRLIGNYIRKKQKASTSKAQDEEKEKKSKDQKLIQKFLKKPGSEKVILLFGVIAAATYFYISVGGGAEMNIFQVTNTNVTSPTFLFREQYKAWVQSKVQSSASWSDLSESLKDYPKRSGDEEEWKEFKKCRYQYKYYQPSHIYYYYVLPVIDYLGQTLFPEKYKSADEEFEYITHDKYEYMHYAILFEKLKSPIKRSLFLKYGENTFIDCHFCTDEMDFLYYLGPILFFSYMKFLIVIGILSTLTRKRNWRNIMIIFLIICAVCEGLYYISPTEMAGALDGYGYLFPDDFQSTAYQKLTVTRHFLFALAIVLTLAFDNGLKSTSSDDDEDEEEDGKKSNKTKSESEIIRSITKDLESNVAKSQLIKLSKLAMVSDKTLRKYYNDHFEKIEKGYSSQEVQTIMKKYDLEKMNEIAQDAIHESINDFVDPAFSKEQT